MLLRTLALPISFLLASAAAQSTAQPTTNAAATTTAPSPSATSTASLSGLVAQLPHCALSCFSQAATDIGCQASDFNCLCSNAQGLISKIGPCLVLGGPCGASDLNKVKSLAPEICQAVNSNPNSADVASASNLVTSAIGSGSATSTTSGNPAARTDVSLGALGVAAAFAVYAL
ncbi:hypothetical protein VTK73DRAFT_5677 [Phialemonium thermophilum]|uniref:CFEM domain-containing protein n=1 Tax=Phialemonium thermophilum TaxID=223376 RepID=A0ABR3WMT6_9PEZI